MVSVSVSRLLLQAVGALLSGRVTTKLNLSVQAATMMRILSLPADFFKKWSSGELASRSAQMQSLCRMLVSAVLTAIYLFTVIGPMYFRPLNADMAHLKDFNRDPNWMMLLPFGLLIAAVIGLGLWGGPLVSFLKDVATGVRF